MKLPRVRVQTLPQYTAEGAPNTPSGRVTPTIRSVEVGYTEADKPQVYRAMKDALIYNLTYIQSVPAPNLDSCINLGMAHNLGRCLWSWPSIASPYFEEGMEAMKQYALRPSSLLPADMQALSPRFACLLLLTNFSKVEREIQRVAEFLGLELRGKVNLAFATSCLDYGSPALRPFNRLEPLAERPGYNDSQSAILALADGGSLPFSHYQLTRGTYEADQAKRLLEIRGAVRADLGILAKELERNPEAAEVVELLQEVDDNTYAKAVDRVMFGRWGELRLEENVSDPDEDVMTLLCRAVIRRMGCEGRDQLISGPHLLCLSMLTGISPAAFVRHAINDFIRRGTTYLSLGDADALGDLVRSMKVEPGMAAGRLEVLAKQLDALARQFSAEHAAKRDWEVELPQKLLKAYTPKLLAFEWTSPRGAVEDFTGRSEVA